MDNKHINVCAMDNNAQSDTQQYTISCSLIKLRGLYATMKLKYKYHPWLSEPMKKFEALVPLCNFVVCKSNNDIVLYPTIHPVRNKETMYFYMNEYFSLQDGTKLEDYKVELTHDEYMLTKC
jgi:hypothetical protein